MKVTSAISGLLNDGWKGQSSRLAGIEPAASGLEKRKHAFIHYERYLARVKKGCVYSDELRYSP